LPPPRGPQNKEGGIQVDRYSGYNAAITDSVEPDYSSYLLI